MKRVFKILISIILIISLFNLSTPYSDFLLRRSITNQIAYLNNKFEAGLGKKLQERYPEGELFGNLIFALSLIKYSEKYEIPDINQIENAILKTTSKGAKNNFTKDLPLEYGAFYTGWINFTLKKYVESEIFKKSTRKETFINLYHHFSNKIIKAQKDTIQLLESYSNSIWPADNIVCIASLSSDNQELKKLWFDKIQIKSKSDKKLINHYSENPSEIRGSSQALIAYFLANIDKNQAKEYFDRYKSLFTKKLIGISFVKEYQGDNNSEDIDSGPIILGFGSVATIMNAKAMATLDIKGAKSTWSFLNFISLPINLFGKKYYLLGKEPIYDIFLLWIAVDLI